MKIGEPFNPRYDSCRFFPAEIVDKRRDLTDGQKLLYHRMVGWARLEDGERHNERAGEVSRSHETIADDLGKGERQIRRDLEAPGIRASARPPDAGRPKVQHVLFLVPSLI